jgi:hypothetical protein
MFFFFFFRMKILLPYFLIYRFETLREQMKDAFEEEVALGARLIDQITTTAKGGAGQQASASIQLLQKSFLKLLYRFVHPAYFSFNYDLLPYVFFFPTNFQRFTWQF